MIEIEEIIRSSVQSVLVGMGIHIDEESIVLEHPADLINGDYSCNIAMCFAKELGKSPHELAEEIAAALSESNTHISIERVEVAGSGFINFYLSQGFFAKSLAEALEQGMVWGSVDLHKSKRMLIEHSSPNLFKPFHLGHLVNNTYGEALIRLARAANAEVTTLSFPSDVSPGIAKAVWGLLNAGLQESFTIKQVGEAYVAGSSAYKDEEDKTAKVRIDEINVNIYNQNKDTPEWQVYQQGRSLSLDYFKHITKRLGSEFDDFIYESESEKEGKKIIKANTPSIFEESDGAVIFRGSEYGLFDNVYINSAGFGTYLAKDTGLLSIKFSKYDFDKSITVTDIEQKQHFELVKKSAELINKEWAEKSLYVQHGRLALTTGRISSRDGGVPLAADILDNVKQAAKQRTGESNKETTDEAAESIAIGAIKYAIAKVSMGKNIVFDLEKSLSFEGDSGPYLQYTYARCRSVLTKAYPHRGNLTVQMPKGWAVTDIEKLLYRFPEVVARAALEYEPHYLANYLNELASSYNSWYGQGKILDDGAEQEYKLALTDATALTIKNGLYLLGIDAPERM